MMKLSLLCLSLFLPVLVFADGGLPNQPYIYVEGEAETQKPAETAKLQFSLVARNADQAKANEEAQASAARILAMLNERKIAENDVIAQDVRSEPLYEDCESGGRGKIIGSSVTRYFEVTLRTLSALPKLVDDLLAISGVEFTEIGTGLENEKEVRDEMSARALSHSRESAEKTVKALGMKIDGVFAISPVSIGEARKRMTERGERIVVTGSYIPTKPKLDARYYRLTPVTVFQSVHVIYLISPSK